MPDLLLLFRYPCQAQPDLRLLVEAKLIPRPIGSTSIQIELYEGPVFLSHGTEDKMWSVEMTKRLEEKLKNRKSHFEVHYYEGEDHICRGEADNKHHELLIQFFKRFL